MIYMYDGYYGWFSIVMDGWKKDFNAMIDVGKIIWDWVSIYVD